MLCVSCLGQCVGLCVYVRFGVLGLGCRVMLYVRCEVCWVRLSDWFECYM